MVNKDTQGQQQTKALKSNVMPSNGKKPNITLNEAKKKGRNSSTKSTNDAVVKDIYQNVSKPIKSPLSSLFESFFCRFSAKACAKSALNS